MSFQQSPLPYPKNALEPHISERTLHYHYDKHHRQYVDKLNEALKGKPEAEKPLEELVMTLPAGKAFNLAAQAWNHAFYWRCMSPQGGGNPEGGLGKRIKEDFGSVKELRQNLAEAARDEFGSGWAWLTVTPEGTLKILSTTDAENPLQLNHTPLLTIDVWEHAYYLDYQNERARYIEAYLDHLMCWEFASENYRDWHVAMEGTVPAA